MKITDFLNEDFDVQINNYPKLYQSNQPYPHIVIDNFLKEKVAESFPKLDGGFWFQYENPIEKKFVSRIKKLTGIKNIYDFLTYMVKAYTTQKNLTNSK